MKNNQITATKEYVHISDQIMANLYDRFLEAITGHEWHRTVVKNALTMQVVELITEDVGRGAAKSYLLNVPYEKEKYFRNIVQHIANKYEYKHHQLICIVSGIIARIQFDVLYDNL
jgi:hypothetical protein